MYDRFMHRLFDRLWYFWHSQSRHQFDVWTNGGRWFQGDRPRWHMCCNGDAGGWRTKFCNWLEEGFRYRHKGYDDES
jgi:hypothetical protein